MYKELEEFDRVPSEYQTKLCLIDILATIKYLIHLNNGEQLLDGRMPGIDDMDHLGRRHLRPVGEQLEEELTNALRMVASSARDSIQQALVDTERKKMLLPKNIINNIPVVSAIKRFFATGELSQFLDQTNPLSDLTSKRRLSALGPGGLSRKHAGFEVRDIHSSSYGRVCPIETPEGANIGLITSLALYSRVNEFGLIETPYRKVSDGKLTDKIDYLSAYEEEKFVIAPSDAADEKTGKLKPGKILARVNGEVKYVDAKEVQY
ncbi:MAG: DNA-directed RNA polymerase subunit beta, partial [Elusimicrobiota bacterium]|nr:DNA-directed RNA polymerase subunit beta [Endomicrobiia bacterium]MDW8166834.1 DNA-directed RNA polymerase subunit beta [Elusimicrobiota bacterium]